MLADRAHDSYAFATVFVERVLDGHFFGSPCSFVSEPEVERSLVEIH